MRLTFLGGLFESKEKQAERTRKETELAAMLSVSQAAVLEVQEKVRCLKLFEERANRLLPPEGNDHDHDRHST